MRARQQQFMTRWVGRACLGRMFPLIHGPGGKKLFPNATVFSGAEAYAVSGDINRQASNYLVKLGLGAM